MIFKKTRIIATIGPASSNELVLTKLIRSGVNVVRLNFSHGDHESHKEVIELVRRVAKKLDSTVAILQDLPGPKIRIGDFYTERVQIKKGSIFTLTTKHCVGDEKIAYVNYKPLPKEVKKGSFILLDDGKKKLQVISTTSTEIKCRVMVGGETKGRRGVNVPGAYLKISSLTENDKEHLAFGIKQNVDFIALSFVRRESDILELKEILKKAGSDAAVIAKIETEEAIENFDKIIEATDAVMVARGDLAVEVPAENVPLLQKKIVKKCNKLGKPVIVATQMLESMIKSPVPTRAEVSDVANSILDGADAVMLSEETALGENPVEAVSMMSSVAGKIEASYPRVSFVDPDVCEVPLKEVVDAVSSSVVNTAHDVGAKVIIALTESGFTARMVSRYKPVQPIIVMTPNEKTVNKVILSFGCRSVVIKPFKYVANVMDQVRKFVLKEKYAKKGDRVIIVAGVPFGQRGGTNMLMVEVI